MNQETKVCQNCKKNFTIESEDFQFYKKIDVPPPTWCPECRMMRRMCFSNERMLYKRKCDLCGKNIISIFPSATPFPVYCVECWNSDKWDPYTYGKGYDFSQPFFEQFFELKKKVPQMALIQQGEMSGSEYTNRASNCKNCYLVFRSNFNENSLYSHSLNNSKDSLDCFNVQQSELMYECIDCFKCYNLKYSMESKDCRNGAFLFDCKNCSDCFGCTNLRNSQHCIFNKQHTKDEYEKKIKTFDFESRAGVAFAEKRFSDLLSKSIREYIVSTHSSRVSGNWLFECKDTKNSFMCRAIENGKWLFAIIEAKDCMDYFYWGRSCERVYETANCGYNSSDIKFCDLVFVGCSNLEYCTNCISSHDMFGCVGIKNGEYSILNKRYRKDEYIDLMQRIKKQMSEVLYEDELGRKFGYGEFFPVEMSFFGYNETAAQDYFPASKEKAEKFGSFWKNSEEKRYEITLFPDDIPLRISDTEDSITEEIIGCFHEGKCDERCTTAFKITPQEFQLYKRFGVPVPQLCPNCRHAARLKKRTPFKIWHRKCMKPGCQNEFETSYAPNRTEIVYCESCYKAEIL